jgi:hypothetical protein
MQSSSVLQLPPGTLPVNGGVVVPVDEVGSEPEPPLPPVLLPPVLLPLAVPVDVGPVPVIVGAVMSVESSSPLGGALVPASPPGVGLIVSSLAAHALSARADRTNPHRQDRSIVVQDSSTRRVAPRPNSSAASIDSLWKKGVPMKRIE